MQTEYTCFLPSLFDYCVCAHPIPGVSACQRPLTADKSVCLFVFLDCCAMCEMFVSLFLVCSFILHLIPVVSVLQCPMTEDQSDCLFPSRFVFCLSYVYLFSWFAYRCTSAPLTLIWFIWLFFSWLFSLNHVSLFVCFLFWFVCRCTSTSCDCGPVWLSADTSSHSVPCHPTTILLCLFVWKETRLSKPPLITTSVNLSSDCDATSWIGKVDVYTILTRRTVWRWRTTWQVTTLRWKRSASPRACQGCRWEASSKWLTTHIQNPMEWPSKIDAVMSVPGKWKKSRVISSHSFVR